MWRRAQPRAPAGACPKEEVAVAWCRAAAAGRVTLVPDFCPVQPHFQLYNTGTQERPNWVLSQAPALNPQLLAAGLAVPGLPGGGTAVCHAKGGRAGIAILRATQPVSSCAAHPAPAAAPLPGQPCQKWVWLAASHSGNCRGPEPSGCFPGAQAAAASAGTGLAPLEPLS